MMVERKVAKYTVIVPYKTWEGSSEVELLADYVHVGKDQLIFYLNNEQNMVFNNHGGWYSYYKED